MRITLNGAARDLPDGATVAELLDSTGAARDRVAVAVNSRIVPRSRLSETRLSPGDTVELIEAVGGG